MSATRTTIMVLVPGRTALSIAAPRAPGTAVIGALLLPLLTGVVAQRCFQSLRSSAGSAAIASLSRVQIPSASHVASPTPHDTRSAAIGLPVSPRLKLTLPQPSAAGVTLATTSPNPAASPSSVVNVQSVVHAINLHRKGGPTDTELAQIPGNGTLRLEALHLGEVLNVRPFDDAFHPVAEAIAPIDHALRCRVTGTEISIDHSLIGILVRLHSLYGRAIQLVSGHREPKTLGTKPTSQHALGRAADIRIPGVSIEELERVALKFGARGVGLYPEKGFVHIDTRQKAQYRWVYTAADGEQADMGLERPKRVVSVGAPVIAPDSESESDAADAANGGDAPKVMTKAAAAPVKAKTVKVAKPVETANLGEMANTLNAANSDEHAVPEAPAPANPPAAAAPAIAPSGIE
jgi:uncharacterized protein YcbK (DUF882 family)